MRCINGTIENECGFTLLEVIIAMFVFAIGILAVASLQGKAIQQNSSAFVRTRANAVATAVLEELKRLPFDDPTLTGNNKLDVGSAISGGVPQPTVADHVFDATELPGLENSYQFDTNTGDITDGAGKTFQIFWNVERTNTITFGTDTYIPTLNIRLFIYWMTPLGRNHIEMTAVKYNNDI